MTSILLAVWVALFGADRIDLAGGALPMVVTPFLVLTPVLALAQAAHRYRTGRPLHVNTGGRLYFALLLAFLCLIGVSVFWSLDAESSMARSMLVVAQALGTLVIGLHVHDEPGSGRWLARGAAAGILLSVVANVLAILAFLGTLPDELPLGFAVVKLQSFGYAGIIPRLSGLVLDPNRGGLLLVIYAVLAPRFRLLAVILLVLTLSRSAALAGLTVVAFALLQRGAAHRRVPRRLLIATVILLAAGVMLLGRSAGSLEATERALDPFSERFSVSGEGSASTHTALLVRAAEEGTRSTGRALFGLGWGASHVVLQDVFPGNRYGNFHSLYATVFVEAGLAAAMLVLVLLAVPILRSQEWRGLVGGAAAFSIFYQATAEPAFWFVLAMGWLSWGDTPARTPPDRVETT